MLAPYASKLVAWFVGQAGNFSLLVLHFLLSIGIAAVLYANGETAASGIRKFARRLASQSGDEVAVLSAKAIRGVALGIVVTALVQSSLGGIGLFLGRRARRRAAHGGDADALHRAGRAGVGADSRRHLAVSQRP